MFLTEVDGYIFFGKQTDERGYFARSGCDREAAAEELRTPMVQDSIAFNERRERFGGCTITPRPFPS